MMKVLGMIVAVLALVALAAPTTGSLSLSKDMKLFTKLKENGLASGHAVYKEKPKKGDIQKIFKVQVEDMTPGAVLDVAVNGVVIKQITVGPLGTVEMTMKSITDDPPGPQNVPTMKSGDVVTVGPLKGTLKIVE